MNEPTERAGPDGARKPYGHPCPECGALRAADSTPSCDCARRAAEALKEARLADAAAAEDFDPLRIRPYVELAGTAGAPAAGGIKPPPDATMRLRAVPPGLTPAAPSPDATATAPLPKIPGTGPTAPRTPGEPGPRSTGGAQASRSTGEPGPRSTPGPSTPRSTGEPGAPEAEATEPGPRRRRTILLATSGAVVAVLAAAGFATGLFAYDAPARDDSPPEDIRAAVPAPSTTAVSEPSAPARTVDPAPVSDPPTPSESAAPSPSPTPTRASASPSAAASGPSAEVSPSGAAGDEQAQVPSLTVAVLRRGDTGSEVRELQLRLTQTGLYTEAADGVFDEQVEVALKEYQRSRDVTGDERGVYGAVTRERLEKETKEP
ncbi:peptidoglycan-binding protein [Streptomyces sp. NPDC004539]|uniref:peptidoglycan-binding protein n=1 Tax=Streptomyces sp. NPDC004539 TaxID=3154280 RepID=UPI0033A06162